MAGDEVAQFVGADLVAVRLRVGARQADHQVGRDAEDPYRRARKAGEQIKRAGDDQRPPLGARCIAIRFGASSPTTSVRYDRTRVTAMIATGSAAPSSNGVSSGTNGSASATAAVAEARNPARVMPIWMVARNRFGSRASLARIRPLVLRRSNAWSWLSRSDTNAISLPANAALSSTSTATSTSW